VVPSTLNIEAICSFETSVDFQRAAQLYSTCDRTLHNHRGKNLNFYTFLNLCMVLYVFHGNIAYSVKSVCYIVAIIIRRTDGLRLPLHTPFFCIFDEKIA
jgi:hypothetical protein